MSYIGKCVCGRKIYVQNDDISSEAVEDTPLGYEPLVDTVTYTDKPKPRPQPRRQERNYDRLSYTPLLEEAPQPSKRLGWKSTNDTSIIQETPTTQAAPTSSKRLGWGVGAGTGKTTRHRYEFQKSESSSQKMYERKAPKRTSGSAKKRTGW